MKLEILGLLLCEFSRTNERVFALWSNREFCRLGYIKQSVANSAMWSEIRKKSNRERFFCALERGVNEKSRLFG